jgi:hypothetical protein
MVSTTRVIRKNNNFTQSDANFLLNKKLSSLKIYSKKLECFMDDILDKYKVIPVLHILVPSKLNEYLCIVAYENIKKNKFI